MAGPIRSPAKLDNPRQIHLLGSAKTRTGPSIRHLKTNVGNRLNKALDALEDA